MMRERNWEDVAVNQTSHQRASSLQRVKLKKKQNPQLNEYRVRAANLQK